MKKQAIALIVLIIIGIAGIAIWYLAYKNKVSDDGKISVVASLYPLEFLASEIVGEHGTITTVVPAGTEPHGFEVPAEAIKSMEKADVVLINGNNIENFEKAARDIAAKKGNRLIVASEGIANIQSENTADPHIWLSPKNASALSDRIAAAVIDADPEYKISYEANLAELKKELEEIDTLYEVTLKSCKRKEFVTSHAAFSYLAREYGLTQIPVAGISSESEPSADDLASIAKMIKEKSITTIFSEPLSESKFIKTLANETGTKILTLNPIEGLTTSEIEADEDYLSLMRKNLANLSEALECIPATKL